MKKLTKEEMKNVKGGLNIPCWAQGPNGGATCWHGDSTSANMAAAQAYANANGTHWCCSSCASATWLHPIN